MTERGYRQVSHSADVAMQIWAPSEEGLLAQGAAAIAALLTGNEVLHPRRQAQRRLVLNGFPQPGGWGSS